MLSVASLVLLNKYSGAMQEGPRPSDSWNFSRLDRVTLAFFMNEEETAYVSVAQMYLYSLLAYFFLFSFSAKMSEFEFFSSNAFIDRLVANHSLIITGVNTEMSTELAAKKVKKVFDYRFRGEDTKVVSCKAYRKSENMQKHWRKVKSYRAK